MKFRKKPVVIEATQFTQAMRESYHFDGGGLPEGVVCTGSSIHPDRREIYRDRFIIHTLEGDHEVSVGDWIITGVKGERYPCKPDIFEATYERVGGVK